MDLPGSAGQADIKQKRPSVSFHIGCEEKVWSRLREGLLSSDNPDVEQVFSPHILWFKENVSQVCPAAWAFIYSSCREVGKQELLSQRALMKTRKE